jgi:hypothetical protein
LTTTPAPLTINAPLRATMKTLWCSAHQPIERRFIDLKAVAAGSPALLTRMSGREPEDAAPQLHYRCVEWQYSSPAAASGGYLRDASSSGVRLFTMTPARPCHCEARPIPRRPIQRNLAVGRRRCRG